MDVLSEEGDAEAYDGTVGPLVFDGDAEDMLDEEITNRFGDDTTQELRAMLASRRRSRASDINLPAGADLDDEPTFRFTMPQRSRDPSILLPQLDDEEDEDAEGEDEDEGAVVAADEPADAVLGVDGEEADYETDPDADLDQEMEVEEDEQVSAPHLRQSSIRRSLSPAVNPKKQSQARRKSLQISRYGKDTLDAISQASDWFFEQVGEDLASYAEHAGRKTIEDADVVALMSRQRQISASTTPFSLAQKYLPRELLQEIRMPRAAPKSKRSTARKRSRMEMETIEEEAEE
ncbi:hypothetical protein GTA08_BOTSDO02218 [Neofusicoccum parvum]|nr:hypothetical protein GTA08_BOTSDO02218 [Neofusicoccum parvum]